MACRRCLYRGKAEQSEKLSPRIALTLRGEFFDLACRRLLLSRQSWTERKFIAADCTGTERGIFLIWRVAAACIAANLNRAKYYRRGLH